MDSFKKLRDKKDEKKMHPMEQKAKMSVLDDLGKMADEAMGGKLSGMQKVTVASDDKEGLEHGLDQAKSLLGKLPPAFDDSHPDHENFTADQSHEDGDDGMDAYDDSDDDHALESDPAAAHEEDEMAEHGKKMAEGGMMEHSDEDEMDGEGDPLNNMDDDKLAEQLEQLRELMKTHPHLFKK